MRLAEKIQARLLKMMSTRLRGDAAYRMCQYHLRSVPFLVDPSLEPEFMCHLAIKFRTCVYSRLERVPCTDLFIVERGVVAKRGHLGLAGACFGKDVILASDNVRTAPVQPPSAAECAELGGHGTQKPPNDDEQLCFGAPFAHVPHVLAGGATDCR